MSTAITGSTDSTSLPGFGGHPGFITSRIVMIVPAGGLYWLLDGVVFSLIASLFDAWVLLIEIQR